MSLLRNIKKNLSNIPGWRTNRKVLVIESDDWGSIRMPSYETYKKCLRAGYPVDKNIYESCDSLLSQDDLEMLFELLMGFRDKNGNHPVMTVNCVVANPDFEKIKQDNFNNYHFELITETFKRYPKHANNFRLWQQGIENKVIFLQYHCREHLNVSLFMEALKRNDHDVHFAFENRMPGSIPSGSVNKGNSYVEATMYHSLADKVDKLAIFLEGLDIFEKLFGYKSESVIPPNYIWSTEFNKPVFEKGVKVFQGIRKIIEPKIGGTFKNHYVYLGKKNYLGQIYLVRNVFFEPSLLKNEIKEPVDWCLSDMAAAFRMKKPAIIGCHRINFAGFIDETNRNRTLELLKQLLAEALHQWPDIEFMTSAQLGQLILDSE